MQVGSGGGGGTFDVDDGVVGGYTSVCKNEAIESS